MKSQLSTSLRSRETELKLAHEQRSDSIAWVILIDQGRVYAAARGVVPLHLLGSDQVECTSTGLRTCVLTPKLGTGWSIVSREFKEFQMEARRSGVEMMVAIWPTSYGYFREVKRQLIDNDLKYSLYPMQQGEVFELVSGGGRTVQ